MKKLLLPMTLAAACSKQDSVSTFGQSNVSVIQPDHVIIVFLENRGFNQIINNSNAAYINSLKDNGYLFKNFHGIAHPSYPNYIAFFSGSTQGITSDACLEVKYKAQNLYSKLKAVGKTCAWYSEDLPAQGSTICKASNYAEKHNASTVFNNVPDSANKMFSQLPHDYTQLENLVLITPNLINDMHSGTVQQGDVWIQTKLGALADWCKNNNSIFIITFDEDNHTPENRIPVILYGEHVVTGSDSINYDHYNMTRTICSLFGANQGWTDSLKNRKAIKGFLK